MEIITLAALATILAPYFQKAGETVAVESVKLALEKRENIKNSFLNLFKSEDFISLGLNEYQKPEEVKALLEANTQEAKAVRQKIESNRELIDELATVLSQQEGMTINAEKIGQVVKENYGTINQTVNF